MGRTELLRPLALGRELHVALPVVDQLRGGHRLRLDQEAEAEVAFEMETGLVLLLYSAAACWPCMVSSIGSTPTCAPSLKLTVGA
eukprot:Skav202259  [mRNA]  locus=scaffold1417:389135:389389:- [translate_table: standard]